MLFRLLDNKLFNKINILVIYFGWGLRIWDGDWDGIKLRIVIKILFKKN